MIFPHWKDAEGFLFWVHIHEPDLWHHIHDDHWWEDIERMLAIKRKSKWGDAMKGAFNRWTLGE
jgi:hypothetical protein